MDGAPLRWLIGVFATLLLLMERTLTSSWFLASAAACCGLAAAFTTWLTNDSSGGVRALAALIGIGAVLAVLLLIAWAVAAEDAPSAAAVPGPTPAPVQAQAVTDPAPPSSSARSVLTTLLEDGFALREELEPARTDPRVDAWIDRVTQTIDRHRPGVAGYVNALSQRAYADDGARLDAYIKRLGTVVRDLI